MAKHSAGSDAAPRTHRLDNGLRVILHRDGSLPLVALHLTYRVGSKNERPGSTGLAHLFEHMLFQGSEHVAKGDHFALIQQVGGVANGSTGRDRTSYYETVPQQCLELALWLESDRMGFLLPALSREKLDNQRRVVINERRQRVDNQPYGRCFERIHELLYPAPHPYHWPVIGYPDDLPRATLADLERFFRTYYSPSNAVLALAGDIEPDAALELVTRYFNEIEASGPVEPETTTAAFQNDGPVREELKDRVELPRVYLAYPGPPFGGNDWRAADLLSTLLSGGKTSPLYGDLVYDRQIARDVAAFVVPGELASTFLVVATANAGCDPSELRRHLLDHIDRARRSPGSSHDLERARNRVLTGWHSGLQGFDRRADLMALFSVATGDPSRPFSEAGRYLELEGADLRAFAERTLRSRNRVELTVIPETGGR